LLALLAALLSDALLLARCGVRRIGSGGNIGGQLSPYMKKLGGGTFGNAFGSPLERLLIAPPPEVVKV
jgi:hypothetical protein